MKKNILTIIIMAIVLINTVLTAVLVFTIVPTANRTTQLVNKVASIIDLELEAPEKEEDIAVSDITTYSIADPVTINLDGKDGKAHFASVEVSLSLNSKHEDYTSLEPKLDENKNAIEEIIGDEFSKYMYEDVKANKDAIKEAAKKRIQELFKSDFIISVYFGNLILQ
jgi:flagellar basal body-associated protein FliL